MLPSTFSQNSVVFSEIPVFARNCEMPFLTAYIFENSHRRTAKLTPWVKSAPLNMKTLPISTPNVYIQSYQRLKMAFGHYDQKQEFS